MREGGRERERRTVPVTEVTAPETPLLELSRGILSIECLLEMNEVWIGCVVVR